MQKNNNVEIRQAIAERRLYYYEVAEAIGISSFTFSTWMRNELPDDKKQMILETIKRIK